MQRGGNTPPKKPGRVSLPLVVTPPKGHPFAGATGLNAPARDTRIPDLTAHVALAAAQKQRLQQGGLLTPQQQKHEAAAAKVLAKKPPAKTATPPAGAKRSAPESAPHPPTGLRGAPTPPKQKAPVTSPRLPASLTQLQPAASATPAAPQLGPRAGMAAAEAAKPKGQLTDLSGPVAGIKNAVTNEISTSLHDPYGVAANLLTPGLGVAGETIMHHLGINATTAIGKAGNKVAAKISKAGDKAGSIDISLLPPVYAKTFPGQKKITEQQIEEVQAKEGKLGLFPKELRKSLIEASVKENHWPREDVENAVDSDLLHYYSNKPSNPVVQFAKNAGAGVARQAAGPAGLVALGAAGVEAAQGNFDLAKKQAQQAVEGSMVGLPVIGKHPFFHDIYWHPVESAQNLSMVVGGADTALGRAGKFAPGVAREVTPEGFTKPVSRGELSTKPLQRGIEKARDAYVRNENPILNAAIEKRGHTIPLFGPASPLSRRTAIAKADYLATRDRAIGGTMAHTNQLRANVMQAAHTIGKDRAAAINAHLQGLDSPARQAFYESVAKDLGAIKGRGAKAHAKLSAKHPVTEETMTPHERAYANAVREAADFSTSTRADLGQLDVNLSGRYRAYQLPIVAATKSGDALGTRLQALHKTWTDALAKKQTPEELAPIADAFSAGLDEFTARHAEAGGTTPVYIPQEVPQTLTSGYRREASVTANRKIPKLKATQDKLITSGQYRSTPGGISLETHRAGVLRARIDHFKAVEEEYATKAENGGAADPNVVYVKAENLRSPVKLANTVGEHNLTDEQVHSTLDQMRQALEGGKVDVTGGYIPAHGDIRAIPKTIYDELHASTQLQQGAPIGQLYDAANRKYMRLMLSKPSTAAANIVGNPILAMMGGASPWEATVGGYKALANPELLPPQLMGEGLAAVAGQRSARTPVGKYINFSLSHQRASEDAARAALYHHVVGPHVRKVMKETGASADQVLKDLASGKDTHVHAFVKHVEDFLGSMRQSAKIHKGTEQMLSRGILFHRWLGHILTLTLYTMPVKYPGRAVILQRISEIGDDYRKHHGVWPSWYAGMIPIMQHIMESAGVSGRYTRVLPTGSIWPTSNLQLPLSDGSGTNPYGFVVNSLNPGIRAAIEAPTGLNMESLTPYTDQHGDKITPGLGPANAKLFAGQMYRATPYASVVTPMPGRTPDSFPGNMHNAVHKNRYHHALPPGFETTAIPYGGNTPSLSLGYLAGALSRLAVGGSGLQDLPTNTQGTRYTSTASHIKANKGHQKLVREAAKARAKKP